MEIKLNDCFIEIKQGDITKEKVDAIVNAANSQLKHGGGVAYAIVKAGGRVIQEESDKIGYCPLGGAVYTSGGNLPAKYVIHTVGPRYGIDPEPEKNLYNAVYNSLKLGETLKVKSIALPAISTGIYGYPIEEAAEVILKAVKDFAIKDANSIERIVLCLFSDRDFEVFKKSCEKICE